MKAEDCIDADPWVIAEKLGVNYDGDMNPIPHDGVFWTHDEYGFYAVRIQSTEEETGILWVESGIYVVPDDVVVDGDFWIGEYTFEVDEDFSGRYCEEFRGDDEWGEFDELAVWEVALPWIGCIADTVLS